MKRKKLRSIFRKNIIAIQRHSHRAFLVDSEEDIHQLRLAFKKTRAFARLLSFADSVDRRKSLTGLKEIYRAAGKLRDLQILQQSVSAHSEILNIRDSLYLKSLASRIVGAKATVYSLIQGFSFDSVVATLLKKIPPKVRMKVVREYIENRLAAISVNLLKRLNDVQIHQVRRLLKDIDYCMASLPANKNGLTRLRKGRRKIKKLASLLGAYHDACVSETHLRSAASDTQEAGEATILRKLKKKNTFQKHLLKETVIQQLYIFKYETLPSLRISKDREWYAWSGRADCPKD